MTLLRKIESQLEEYRITNFNCASDAAFGFNKVHLRLLNVLFAEQQTLDACHPLKSIEQYVDSKYAYVSLERSFEILWANLEFIKSRYVFATSSKLRFNQFVGPCLVLQLM